MILTQEELEAVEPGRSRTIDITDFVNLDEINPILFQKTYYLAPRGDEAIRPLYAAARGHGRYQQGRHRHLRDARQAVPCLPARRRERARPGDDVLRRRGPRTGERDDQLPRKRSFATRDLNTAKQLIDSLSVALDPSTYHDAYREKVEDLIERKRKGEGVVTEEQPREAETEVLDLTDTL